MDACAESEIFEMDMRKLQIDMAISRTQVNDIVDEKSKKTETKDNRHLALLKEGVIYPNSYEAKNISKADMLRRQKLEKDNSEKLKLLHYFVSPTRLSVHNIPIKCTDEEFRQLFYNAIDCDQKSEVKSRNQRGGITECRIMRDLSRVTADGVGRSKGYGFVEFTNFELAKKALHGTNNNEKLFPSSNRLIVQFSVEDMRALAKKKARLDKSKLKTLKKASAFDRYGKKEKRGAAAAQAAISKLDQHDQQEDQSKLKQKNLLKVHTIEKKILKKKNEEEKLTEKRQTKATFNQKKIIEKLSEKEKEIQMINDKKTLRHKNKKLNRKEKLKLKGKAIQTVDNVDKLVDKLYNSKNNVREKKWYD